MMAWWWCDGGGGRGDGNSPASLPARETWAPNPNVFAYVHMGGSVPLLPRCGFGEVGLFTPSRLGGEVWGYG
jgi:hypothetical protein